MATTQAAIPDGSGRRRWLVVVSCFVSALTTGSSGYHTGVLYMALLEVFQKDVVTTSWLGAIYSCTFALCGPLASFVVNRFDCRVTLMLAGLLHVLGLSSCYFITQFPLLYPALILAGVGQGLSMTGTSVALSYHFPDKNSLVSGICVCGAGLGVFIHPSLMQLLLDNYGLHGALLIVGAIGLHSIPCGVLMPLSRFELHAKRPTARRRQGDEADGSFCCACPDVASYIRVLTDLRYLVYLLSIFILSVAFSGFYLHLPKFLVLNGYTPLQASFVISLTGVGSVLSRLLSGMATLDGTVDKILIYSGISFFAAIAVLLIPATVGSATAQFVLAVVFGLYTGGFVTLMAPLALEILGLKHVSTGMGVWWFTLGAGYVVGPPVAGLIFVAGHDYHHAFYFVASLFVVASFSGMCMTLFPTRHVRRHSGDKRSSFQTSRDGDVTLLRDQEMVVMVVQGEQLSSSTNSATSELQPTLMEVPCDLRKSRENLEPSGNSVAVDAASVSQTRQTEVFPSLERSKESRPLLEKRADDGENEFLSTNGARQRHDGVDNSLQNQDRQGSLRDT